jgi:hypothetical protein
VFTLLFLLVFLLDREACALVIVCAQGLISHPPDFLRRSLLIFLLRASASPRSVFFFSPLLLPAAQDLLAPATGLAVRVLSSRDYFQPPPVWPEQLWFNAPLSCLPPRDPRLFEPTCLDLTWLPLVRQSYRPV